METVAAMDNTSWLLWVLLLGFCYSVCQPFPCLWKSSSRIAIGKEWVVRLISASYCLSQIATLKHPQSRTASTSLALILALIWHPLLAQIWQQRGIYCSQVQSSLAIAISGSISNQMRHNPTICRWSNYNQLANIKVKQPIHSIWSIRLQARPSSMIVLVTKTQRIKDKAVGKSLEKKQPDKTQPNKHLQNAKACHQT